MLTDSQIQDLVSCSQRITKKEPATGYRKEGHHLRCDMELVSSEDSNTTFTVFIRRSTEFIENFSIGLRFRNNDPVGTITLVRYNGPHGENSRDPDGHYARPHIHRLTASELESGSAQPQEKVREITDRYSTFEQGLTVFFSDTYVVNFREYFPNILQGSFFDEHV